MDGSESTAASLGGNLLTLDEARDYIKHHGVKGMKWGVRRDSPGSVSVSVATKPGRRARVSGGSGQAAHPDAVRARTYHQTAKKSTTDALSDAELQALIKRMNLEAQHAKFNPGTVKKGLAAAGVVLAVGATLNQAIAFQKGPTGQTVTKVLKDAGLLKTGKHRAIIK